MIYIYFFKKALNYTVCESYPNVAFILSLNEEERGRWKSLGKNIPEGTSGQRCWGWKGWSQLEEKTGRREFNGGGDGDGWGLVCIYDSGKGAVPVSGSHVSALLCLCRGQTTHLLNRGSLFYFILFFLLIRQMYIGICISSAIINMFILSTKDPHDLPCVCFTRGGSNCHSCQVKHPLDTK